MDEPSTKSTNDGDHDRDQHVARRRAARGLGRRLGTHGIRSSRGGPPCAQDGGDDYAAALDKVLAQAAAGVITLSAAAAEGTGLDPTGPGWRDRADIVPVAPEDDPRFRDAVSHVAFKRGGSPHPGTGVGRRSESLDRRDGAIRRLAAATGETYQQCVQRMENDEMNQGVDT